MNNPIPFTNFVVNLELFKVSQCANYFMLLFENRIIIGKTLNESKYGALYWYQNRFFCWYLFENNDLSCCMLQMRHVQNT